MYLAKKLINFFFKNKIKNIFRIKNKNDVYKNLIKEKINSIIMDLSYFKNIKSGKIFKIKKFYKDKNIYLISFDDPRHKILSDISIIPYDYDLDKLKIINKNNKLFLGREYFLFSNQVKKLSLKKKKINKKVKKVLISVSGTDFKNIGNNVLKLLNLTDIKFTIVQGKKSNTVKTKQINSKNIKYLNYTNNLPELIYKQMWL